MQNGEIGNRDVLSFIVYIQASGLHIAVCRNCPAITYSCTSKSDCINKAKEKLTLYLRSGKSLTDFNIGKEQLSKSDVWQFNLIFDTKNKSFVKVEIAESLKSGM